MMNVINGGKHAEGALQFQECMIVPLGATSEAEAVRCGAEVFHALGKLLHDRDLPTLVGDEGGYAPPLETPQQALDLIVAAIERRRLQSRRRRCDRARSGLERILSATASTTRSRHDRGLSADEMVALYASCAIAIRSCRSKTGWPKTIGPAGRKLTEALGNRVQLVGDDIFVTNVKFLERGIAEGVANAILIKVNQIGTLTETLDAVEMAHKAGYATVISHRSGETEDTTIADIAVATGAGQIKTGSLSRSDRIAKYNRLMAIEDELGARGTLSGSPGFPLT